MCGSVRVGHVVRRIARPDVDVHMKAEADAKGFWLPGGCLIALCRLMGGEAGGLHAMVRFGGHVQSLVTSHPLLRDLSSFQSMRAINATQGWCVADLWWANSRLLKLRASTQPGAGGEPVATLLRVFQPLPQAGGGLKLTVVDELPLVGKASITPLSVRNPLLPILFVGYDDAGEILFTDLMPFPSLLRGGLHEAEVAAVGEQGGTVEDFRRLSDAYLAEAAGWGREDLVSTIAEIEVDLSSATGGEAIFDPAVGAWLTAGFHVALGAANAAQRVDRDLGDRSFVEHAEAQLARTKAGPSGGPIRAGRARLSLPSRAIPTVGAVVSRRLPVPAARQPGPHIVVDEAFPHRRYLVAFPASAPRSLYYSLEAGLGEAPYLTLLEGAEGKDDGATDHIQPVAILLKDFKPKDQVLKVFPVPKDQPDIFPARSPVVAVKASVIVPVLRPDLDVRMLLSTVAVQVTSVACEVVLAVANCPARQTAQLSALLDEALPGRGQIVQVEEALNRSEALNRAAAAATGEAFVFLDSSVILHDHRTIETLARIACMEGMGTVGCMHLKSRQGKDGAPTFSSAGYFPARVDFAIAPHLGLSEFDCSQILVNALYPVVANSPHCFAVSAAGWRQAGGLSSRLPNSFAEVDLAVRLAEAGHTNVCTTLLSVFTDAHGSLDRLTDVLAPSNLTLWRLIPALKASTSIRAF